MFFYRQDISLEFISYSYLIFLAPSLMKFAIHVDSHKGKAGQKGTLLVKGSSSQGGITPPMGTQMISQMKTLMSSSQQLIQQTTKQQTEQQLLSLKHQKNLQMKCPQCAFIGANIQDLKVWSPLLLTLTKKDLLLICCRSTMTKFTGLMESPGLKMLSGFVSRRS